MPIHIFAEICHKLLDWRTDQYQHPFNIMSLVWLIKIQYSFRHIGHLYEALCLSRLHLFQSYFTWYFVPWKLVSTCHKAAQECYRLPPEPGSLTAVFLPPLTHTNMEVCLLTRLLLKIAVYIEPPSTSVLVCTVPDLILHPSVYGRSTALPCCDVLSPRMIVGSLDGKRLHFSLALF